jgi:hypothetical protein
MRRVMKAPWLGQDLFDLSTIEDGSSAEEIRDAIEKMTEKTSRNIKYH